MERVKVVLGAIAAIIALGAIFVATQIDFGGEGTLVGQIPVAGPVVENLVLSGQGGPMLITTPDAPTCGEFYDTAPGRREAKLGGFGRDLRRAGGADGAQLIAIVALACQTQEPSQRVDRATLALLNDAEAGRRPADAICEAYRRDVAALARAGAPHQSALSAVEQSISDPDPASTYGALVQARAGLGAFQGQLRALRPETNAGRELAELMDRTLGRISQAHAAWLAGAPDAETWLEGAAGDGASRWFGQTEGIISDLQGALDDPDLLAWPTGTGCEPDPSLFTPGAS